MNNLPIKKPKLFAISTLLNSITWAGFCLSIIYAFYEMFYLNNSSIHAENNFIENMQVLVLSITCILFLLGTFSNGEKAKMIPLFFATLAFAFIFREVDFERLDIPEFAKMLSSGKGRNTIMVILFMLVFTGAFLKFKFYLNTVFKFLRTRTFMLGAFAAFILLVSHILERSTSIPNHEFWEELMEFIGYTYFLFSAINYLPRPIGD